MLSILVVDDYATNGMIVKQALTPGRYDVKTVTSGAKALSHLESSLKTDLILLDINMPDMDGLETLKAIRGLHDYKEVPVIFLSGAADKNKVIEGFKLGIDDVLVKPVNPAILNEHVERALRGESPVQLRRARVKSGHPEGEELAGLYDDLMSAFSSTVANLADDDIPEHVPESANAGSTGAGAGAGDFGIDIGNILNGGLW